MQEEYSNIARQLKRIQKELDLCKKENTQLKEVIEQVEQIAHVGHWKKDYTTKSLEWSNAVYAILGEEPQNCKALHINYLNHVHVDDREKLKKSFKEHLKFQKKHEIIYRLITKNGETRYIKEECRTVFKDGKALQSFGIITDISERVEEQKEIEKQRERFQLLFKNSPLGIYIANVNGRIIDGNNSLLKILGSPSLEATKKINVLEFPPLVKNGYAEKFRECVQTKKVLKLEILYISKWNKEAYLQSYLVPLLNKNNEVEHVYTLMQDITKRYETEKELVIAKEKAEKSERVKDIFLRNMSHELRTPMNAILGFTSLLDKNELEPQKLKEILNIIKLSTNELFDIINNILIYASLVTGNEEVTFESIDVNEFLNDIFIKYKEVANDKEIKLKVKNELVNGNLHILADKYKLNLILENLVNNAIKFTHKGYVEIGYAKSSQKILFYVKDTGIGIHEENQATIFDYFTQADSSTNKLYKGTGLGLSIAKSFVDLMNGEIYFESENKVGTIFYVVLPHESSKIESRKKMKKKGKKPLVLVVEDQELNFMYIEELLLDLELDYIHAKNGKEAIKFCKENDDISLVLMDIKMPEMDGFTATKLIREFKPNLPIIAQTAYALQVEVNKYGKVFDDYIIKPISEAVFQNSVNKFIKLHEKV